MMQVYVYICLHNLFRCVIINMIDTLKNIITMYCFSKTGKFRSSASKYDWWVDNNITDYYFQIVFKTEYLNTHERMQIRIAHILNNWDSPRLCINNMCNNTLKWNINLSKYPTVCSRSCASVISRDSAKKTNLELYGHISNLHSEEGKAKKQKTWQKHYNTKHPMKCSIVKDKFSKTNIEKHGYASPLQSPKIQKKIKETNIEKYGYASPLQSP